MRRQRGFILPFAIALCLIMVLVAIMLANQSRSLTTFAFSTESEAQQTEAAAWGVAQVELVLDGDANEIGLQPPTTGTNTSFTARSGEVSLTGKVTVLPLQTAARADAFNTSVKASGAAGLPVPDDYASVVMTASFPGDSVKNRYAAMVSTLAPFALISETGNVSVRSAFSVGDWEGTGGLSDAVPAENNRYHSPLPTHLYGKTGVRVSETLYGRAYSGGKVDLSTQPAFPNGIKHENWVNPVQVPSKFRQQLADFGAKVVNGDFGSDGGALGQRLARLHNDCLHHDFSSSVPTVAQEQAMVPGILTNYDSGTGSAGTPPRDVKTVNSPGNTDYDASNVLTIGTGLRIPAGEKQELRFPRVVVAGALMVEDDALLSIRGDLVAQRIILGRRATLFVQGSTQAQELNVPYHEPGQPITTTLCGLGPVDLAGGMREVKVAASSAVAPTAAGNPFPPTLSLTYTHGDPPTAAAATPANPLATAFQQQQEHCLQQTTADLAPYLVNVQLDPSSGGGPPLNGVLLTSNSAITFQRGAGALGARLTGLLYTNSTINGGWVHGVAWARGDVDLSNRFLYYPYWCHAFPRTFSAANMTLGTPVPHATAYGKLP